MLLRLLYVDYVPHVFVNLYKEWFHLWYFSDRCYVGVYLTAVLPCPVSHLASRCSLLCPLSVLCFSVALSDYPRHVAARSQSAPFRWKSCPALGDTAEALGYTAVEGATVDGTLTSFNIFSTRNKLLFEWRAFCVLLLTV